jgi:HAD superfamily hydrolase (TIGR01509 family)
MASDLKAIFFDIDGVLVDSEDAQIVAFQKLFEKHGFPNVSKQHLASFFGMTSSQIIRKVAGEQPEEKMKKMLQDIHTLSIDVIPLMKPSSVQSIIPSLAQKYSIGVVTNRTKTASMIIGHFNLSSHVSCIVTPWDGKPKPAPDMLLAALQKVGAKPGEAIYFGDTAVDAEAGRAAGVRTVLVGPQTPASFFEKEISLKNQSH